jgi:transposase-like protein
VAPVDSPTGIGTVTISEVTSASDKLRKRQKSEEIIAKLRQVDVLVSQGESIADATHQIGVTEGTYYRWRQQASQLKNNEGRRLKDGEPEAPKAAEVSVDRRDASQTKPTAEITAFEE